MAVAPFVSFKRKEIISFTPFAILTKGVVLMIFCLHLIVTYDNYRRTYCADSSNYSNNCEFKKSQIKKKDNRLTFQSIAVIF